MAYTLKHQININEYLASINYTFNISDNHNSGNDNKEWNHYGSRSTDFDSGPMILLVILYFIVVCSGVFGNASLVVTLFTQTSQRFRNPLLVALCIADLMVTGISAPLTILTMAMAREPIQMASISCKIVYFLRSMPVAASTISLLMLSVDRYATVKNSRVPQLREQRLLPIVLVIVAWLSAIILSVPYLLIYQIVNYNNNNNQSNGYFLRQYHHHNQQYPQHPERFGSSCGPQYGSQNLHILFVCLHIMFVFIIPASCVVVNHLGVRKKLCALSLTARAAHGELPLPMPLLRRPSHMIIVTGMANAGRGIGSVGGVGGLGSGGSSGCCVSGSGGGGNGDGCGGIGQDSSDDEVQKNPINRNNYQHQHYYHHHHHHHQFGKSKKLAATPAERQCIMKDGNPKPNLKTPRALRREIQNHKKSKTNRHGGQCEKVAPASELPLPQTSTLRSRRRLANILVAAAVIFVFCWSPHVICFLGLEFANSYGYCSQIVSDFSLLLGYAHSAVSPLMCWLLNNNALRAPSTSTCGSFFGFSSINRFVHTHLRVPAAPAPPSSTNEAALGPFNPRYIKNRSQPAQYQAPASSYNFY